MRRGPQGQVSSWTKNPPCFRVPGRRIDPVPGGRGKDESEVPVGLPALEGGLDDVHVELLQVLPNQRGQVVARLEGGDRKPSARQRECGATGAAPDLEQPVPGAEPGGRDERLEQPVWILGSCAVVQLGGPVKGLAQVNTIVIGSCGWPRGPIRWGVHRPTLSEDRIPSEPPNRAGPRRAAKSAPTSGGGDVLEGHVDLIDLRPCAARLGQRARAEVVDAGAVARHAARRRDITRRVGTGEEW